jgi:hypothetical protein
MITTKCYGKKAEKIWIIIPFSKSNFIKNTIENIKRQTAKENIKVCIIENGDGIGSCKLNNFKPDLLLTSENHQSIAKNTGLHEIKKTNAEYWTTFDCDDYYGPKYIEELLEKSNLGDVIGKSRIFFKTSDGKLHLINSLPEDSYTKYIHGPTISGWVNQFIDFPIIDYAEDLSWTKKMQDLGAITYSTSCYNFCYNRFKEGNTFKISDEQLLISANDYLSFNFSEKIINNDI